jgi:Tol biopolymer transport system component
VRHDRFPGGALDVLDADRLAERRHLALRSTDHVISILTTNGRETARVTDRQEESTPPRWSPVEDVMAVISGGGFEQDTEIDIVGASGQVTQRIVLPMEVGSIHDWSPDGRQILVEGCMPEPSVARPGYCWQNGAAGGWELWAVDVTTGSPVRLTDSPSTKELWSDWSPDGSRIVYTADCEDAGTPGVPCAASAWTVRPDGSDRQRLTPEGVGAWFPIWAPDGQHLAYSRSASSLPDNPVDHVIVSEADGSDERQVTAFETGYARVVGWSPDGSTLVVTYWRPASPSAESTSADDVVQTWLIGADGSDPRVLVPGTDDVDVTWADPD